MKRTLMPVPIDFVPPPRFSVRRSTALLLAACLFGGGFTLAVWIVGLINRS